MNSPLQQAPNLKEYRLDPHLIAAHTKRSDNRLLKIFTFTMLGMAILMYPMFAQLKASVEVEVGGVLTFSLLLTTLILALIYFNNKKLTQLIAENLVISIDDNSITRSVDLDDEPRMNFLHKYSYQGAKDNSGAIYARIEFVDLKSMKVGRKGDLLIRSTKSSALTGKNTVLVPRELLEFEEVERTIADRLGQ